MKIFLWFLLILFLCTGDLFSQNRKYNKELPLLEIKDQIFDTIVSNAVYSLRKCQNYSKTIVYRITIVNEADSIFIDLAAAHDQKTILSDRYWNPYGYFTRKNHLFFVFCDNLPDFLGESKTKKTFIINDPIDFILAADYTEWLYLYLNKKFMLNRVINECHNRKE